MQLAGLESEGAVVCEFIGLEAVGAVAGPEDVALLVEVVPGEGAGVGLAVVGAGVHGDVCSVADDEAIVGDVHVGGRELEDVGEGVQSFIGDGEGVALLCPESSCEVLHTRWCAFVHDLPGGFLLQVLCAVAAPDAGGGAEVDVVVGGSTGGDGELEVVGGVDGACRHVHAEESESGADVGGLSLYLHVLHLFVLQGAVLELCEVDDIVVVLGGEEVDVAVVVDEDEAMGSGAVVQKLDADVVELVVLVEGGDGLVLGVVGHQFALHEGVDAVAGGDVACADGVGGIDLPGIKGGRPTPQRLPVREGR